MDFCNLRLLFCFVFCFLGVSLVTKKCSLFAQPRFFVPFDMLSSSFGRAMWESLRMSGVLVFVFDDDV